MASPFLIGICGGSASGKTLLAELLLEHFAEQGVGRLSMDDYYLNPAEVPEVIRGNFDHPQAMDLELFGQHLGSMEIGGNLEVPVYASVQHKRSGSRSLKVESLMIVEGHLLFHDETVRNHLHIRFFVEADEDERLKRRIERDALERGRDRASVIQQYEETVAPMHQQFIEPSREWADLVISGMQSPQEMLGCALSYLRQSETFSHKA